jgi:hypothetical protein
MCSGGVGRSCSTSDTPIIFYLFCHDALPTTCEDVFYSLYLAKLLVKFNIKECLSLDLLNLLSICDFPFEIRWEKAGVTDFEKINPLIKSNTLIRYYTIIPNIPTDIKKCSKDNIDNINTESVRLHL